LQTRQDISFKVSPSCASEVVKLVQGHETCLWGVLDAIHEVPWSSFGKKLC